MVDALRILTGGGTRPGTGGTALRAMANNQYVTAGAGAADRQRDRGRRRPSGSTSSTSAAATWRCGPGSTTMFVCAEGAGAQPLIANRAAVGAWETFARVNNSDGTISLRATVNNKYVVAENGGRGSPHRQPRPPSDPGRSSRSSRAEPTHWGQGSGTPWPRPLTRPRTVSRASAARLLPTPT